MATISATDARGLYTKMLIEVYKERTAPTSFLRSFFPVKESPTKNISIEVQRGSERIAVDVQRGTEGNRNSFNNSTEKIFAPPFYREYFEATELDLYDVMMGQGTVDTAIVAAFIDSVADRLRILQDKIERSYELQCSQVLETGIVTLQNGTNIDFKRKAASLVNLTGTPWTSNSYNPLDHLAASCEYLRKTGKAQGNIFNVIMGSSVKAAFNTNTNITAIAEQFTRLNFMDLREPQRAAVGGVSHGRIAAKDYILNIWTYPEFYDTADASGNSYINAKKFVVLPENPNFKLAFAAVPQLIGGPVKKGAFIVGEYKDERNTSHIFDIKSAGVAVPVAVDQIYTGQPIA
jgi:hypothetical protein